MQFSDQFTLLSTPAHLSLVKILLIIMFLLHLPYIGMFIGSSLFSVLFNVAWKRKWRLTRALVWCWELCHYW